MLFRSKIFYTVGRDKATEFGIVVTGLQVIQTCFFVEVVRPVTERVESCYVIYVLKYFAITPSVIGVVSYLR